MFTEVCFPPTHIQCMWRRAAGCRGAMSATKTSSLKAYCKETDTLGNTPICFYFHALNDKIINGVTTLYILLA